MTFNPDKNRAGNESEFSNDVQAVEGSIVALTVVPQSGTQDLLAMVSHIQRLTVDH
jgi:hypothetical protein